MLGIVMLNYNCWDLSINCIESIKKTTHIDYKIYFVDNASTVKPSEKFNEFIASCDKIKFIKNKLNRGYAAGNNIGYKVALEDGCQEILITNNDVIFSDKCLDKLLDALHNNSHIGIIGPKVYTPNGTLQEINMGCKMTLKGKYLYIIRKTPLKRISAKFVRNFHAYDKDKSKPFEVYGVSGCCFMISSECAKKLYSLDENTFLYEEENIISHKVEKLGKKVIYYSPASIVHMGGESTKKLSTFSYSCQVESEIYYCRKYLNSNRFLLFPFVVIRTIIYIYYYGMKDFCIYFTRVKKCFIKNYN